MKAFIAIAIPLLVLTGCTAPLVDAEFGQAQNAVWKSQVIRTEAVQTIPEGTTGIVAEEIMKADTNSYALKRQKTNVMELGLSGKGGRGN